jgi:arylsulfatase A-like enzyme
MKTPVLALATLLTAGTALAEPAKQPNLLIVFPDQMRGSAMGFLGEEPVKTPNLDRFAAQSLVLPQAVSCYPVCSPFRASLMTGQYGFSNGVFSNCNSKTTPAKCELRADAVCWSDVLKVNGYSLGYIGKWHLDSPHQPYVDCGNNKGDMAWNEWCSPDRRHGFGYWYSYGTYDNHLRPLYWDTDAKRDGFHYVDQWGPEHEADQALRFIRNDGGKFRDPAKPFALVVSMNPPHTGYNLVPKRYVNMYKDLDVEAVAKSRPQVPPADKPMGKNFRQNLQFQYAQITGVDEQFGRILAGLKEAGIEGDTIVLFTSDHGDCLGAHNQQTKNNPYEESMRIPMIVRWPGKIAPRRDNLMAGSADLCPTILDLLGLKEKIPASVEGLSLAPAMFGQPDAARPDSQLYLFVNEASGANGDFKIGRRGLRTLDYKLVIERKKDLTETITLFDRKADPNELRNVAADKPELVKTMRAQMEAKLAKIGDPWGK